MAAKVKLESVTQAQLLNETLDLMEDETKINRKQARDFLDSLGAAIEQGIADGKKVMVFGFVNLTPKFRLAKPKRKGVDPRSGEERTYDAQPAKTALGATVGKRLKDALPSTRSAQGKHLEAVAVQARKVAEKRARDREKELQAEAGKSSAKKKSGKKKK